MLKAEKGEKGSSRFVAEALDVYLDNLAPGDAHGDVRKLRGMLGEPDAKDLEERVRSIREGWR